ncbi:MAG TPA: hypothetical protein VN227_04015 [Methanoregula sp.]|nr:hypothetical protein [Methanoregula sp.]
MKKSNDAHREPPGSTAASASSQQKPNGRLNKQGIATETVFLNIDRMFPCVSMHRIS